MYAMRSSVYQRRPISFLLSPISFLSIFFLVLAACRPAPQSSPAPEARQSRSASPAIDPADVWFGYTDDTGSRLLMLQDDGHASDEQAKAIRTAVCSEGRELVLRYIRFKKATAESNGRQNAGNLKNDDGHLLAVDGAATRPGDTCLLLPACYVQRYPLARVIAHRSNCLCALR